MHVHVRVCVEYTLDVLHIYVRACKRERERELFGGKFIEFAMGRENEKPNLSITQHRELLGLLQKPCTPLAEGHLPVHRILDPLHLNLTTSHPDPIDFPAQN